MSGPRTLALLAVVLGGPVLAVAADHAAAGSAELPADAAPPEPAPAARFWASAAYTFGWLRGVTAPPLLSARPVSGGPTTVLFPDGSLNGDGRSGFQLRGGLWLDGCATCGIEAGTLFLCESADRARVGDTPGTVVGRPFFNTLLGTPDIELVSVPGTLSGRAAVEAESSQFCGADVAFRKAICCDCRGRLDALVGYRFL